MSLDKEALTTSLRDTLIYIALVLGVGAILFALAALLGERYILVIAIAIIFFGGWAFRYFEVTDDRERKRAAGAGKKGPD